MKSMHSNALAVLCLSVGLFIQGCESVPVSTVSPDLRCIIPRDVHFASADARTCYLAWKGCPRHQYALSSCGPSQVESVTDLLRVEPVTDLRCIIPRNVRFASADARICFLALRGCPKQQSDFRRCLNCEPRDCDREFTQCLIENDNDDPYCTTTVLIPCLRDLCALP